MAKGNKLELSGYVHADGTKLRDGEGRELLLRGFGFGSWLLPEGYMWRFPAEGDRPRRIEAMIERLIGSERAEVFWDTYYDRYVAEADIVRIAEEGFNSVRLPINARFLMTKDGDAYREERLSLLDRMIGWCRTHGLYVVLDLHGAPGGQTGTNIDDSEFDRPDLFTDERNWRRTVELWRMLASRYKDERIVAGYDLLNEPLPNWFSGLNDKVMPLYRDIIAAIREVDPHHMIILEGVHWSTDWSIFEGAFGERAVDGNVMLQFHKYWNNPDTDSIAGYLELRKKWNVPIFMGEGGENNKDWYAGAFRLFEDHDISWNFWTWKKIDTTNSPCSIRKPAGWELLTAYLQGGEMPDAALAEDILWTYLDNMQLAQCDYRPEVVRSLLRRPPGRIPAVFYGFKGEGISYGFGGDSHSHGRGYSQGPSGRLNEDHCDDSINRSDAGKRAGVGFRIEDRTHIEFVDRDRTTATFEHGGGEEWEPDQWLCLQLATGDWVVYDFEAADSEDGDSNALTLLIMLQSAEGNARLALTLDGQPHDVVEVLPGSWQSVEASRPLHVDGGPHNLTIHCLVGPLRLMWITLEE